jgi:sensor histidine kinase regulating citrate/malate metabolism
MFIVKVIGFSIIIICIIHYVRGFFATKKWTNKDMIQSQTNKYKKMLDEIQKATPSSVAVSFLLPEQKKIMEYELNRIIQMAFQS